jgi:hypothetical protein
MLACRWWLVVAKKEDELERGDPRWRSEVQSAASKIRKDGSSGVPSVFIGLLVVKVTS